MLSNQSLALLMLGSPMGMGMVPELQLDVQGVQKKFQITNFTMPNNNSSMKYALKSVPGLADVGVPMGLGWSQSSNLMSKGSGKISND